VGKKHSQVNYFRALLKVTGTVGMLIFFAILPFIPLERLFSGSITSILLLIILFSGWIGFILEAREAKTSLPFAICNPLLPLICLVLVLILKPSFVPKQHALFFWLSFLGLTSLAFILWYAVVEKRGREHQR